MEWNDQRVFSMFKMECFNRFYQFYAMQLYGIICKRTRKFLEFISATNFEQCRNVIKLFLVLCLSACNLSGVWSVSQDSYRSHVTRRFGEQFAMDYWSSQGSSTIQGLDNAVDCMSMCISDISCFSYAFESDTGLCIHYQSSYRSAVSNRTQGRIYYVFTGTVYTVFLYH